MYPHSDYSGPVASYLDYSAFFSASHAAKMESTDKVTHPGLNPRSLSEPFPRPSSRASNRSTTSKASTSKLKPIEPPSPTMTSSTNDDNGTNTITPVATPPTRCQCQCTYGFGSSKNLLNENDTERMAKSTSSAVKTRSWVSGWFLLTIPIIFWDAGYCFMRPHSFEGGSWHFLWKPYSIYQNVDLVYGVQNYLDKGGFTNAQSFLNIIENIMNMIYLYLAHVSSSPAAPLVGILSATMTLSKTVLYWAQEYFCDYCAVGHNNLKDLLVYWIVPNGLWLIVPSAIIYVLWNDIVGELTVSSMISTPERRTLKLKAKTA